MKWSNLVSLTLLSYFLSFSTHAQPAMSQDGTQQAPASSGDMTIDDSGGNLKISPKTQQPVATPQAPPTQGQMMPNSSSGATMQPPTDNADMGTSPPQGEMQTPSNQNQGMTPATPQQDSMPEPMQGSMQN